MPPPGEWMLGRHPRAFWQAPSLLVLLSEWVGQLTFSLLVHAVITEELRGSYCPQPRHPLPIPMAGWMVTLMSVAPRPLPRYNIVRQYYAMSSTGTKLPVNGKVGSLWWGLRRCRPLYLGAGFPRFPSGRGSSSGNFLSLGFPPPGFLAGSCWRNASPPAPRGSSPKVYG